MDGKIIREGSASGGAPFLKYSRLNDDLRPAYSLHQGRRVCGILDDKIMEEVLEERCKFQRFVGR